MAFIRGHRGLSPVNTEFKFGDRVVHTSRPEWGEGVVTAAAADTVEGMTCQRLTVRFDRAGLKTLSTALARLRPATAMDATPAAANGQATPGQFEAKGWLDRAGAETPEVVMARLPEAATDPFATLEQRLAATLGLYRFTDQGAPLLDWAAAQTGLADPLSIFNRHQLEQYFARYATARDQHLRQLSEELRRKDPGAQERLLAAAPAGAKMALRGRQTTR